MASSCHSGWMPFWAPHATRRCAPNPGAAAPSAAPPRARPEVMVRAADAIAARALGDRRETRRLVCGPSQLEYFRRVKTGGEGRARGAGGDRGGGKQGPRAETPPESPLTP